MATPVVYFSKCSFLAGIFLKASNNVLKESTRPLISSLLYYTCLFSAQISRIIQSVYFYVGETKAFSFMFLVNYFSSANLD